MNYKIFFISFLLILISCAGDQSPDQRFLEIKRLEYTRNSENELWNRLITTNNLSQIVESIGKTGNPALLPILQRHFSGVTNDSLLFAFLFAIGQLDTDQGTKMLLEFPLKNFNIRIQERLVQSLVQNPSNEVFGYFRQLLPESGLKPTLLTALGILEKHTVETSAVKASILDSISRRQSRVELSYYLSNGSSLNDIAIIINMLENSTGDSQKYLLKALTNLLASNQQKVFSIVNRDSLLNLSLNSSLKRILDLKADWANKYYALELSPLVSDSILNAKVSRLCKSPDAHVRIRALHSFAATGAEPALSTLLSSFEIEQQWYIKGEIIKILADFFPNKGFLFIMQNLDKGDRIFKSQLLEALSILETKLAIRTLKQFLNVDDPLLVNSAFTHLQKRHLVQDSEMEILLQSDNFSTVATVLNHKNQAGKLNDLATLTDLYRKFKYPSEFEVQFAVIDALRLLHISAGDSIFSFLIKHAGHDVVRSKIKAVFSDTGNMAVAKIQTGFYLPPHLNPDSIKYYHDNPQFEIVTQKGTIKIELFSGIAPLTVYNFIRLVEMNFYDDLTFHRVVPDFVIQGGDPMGDGWGGPNFFIPSEHSPLSFKRGTLGIATSGFDTGSSQFFICQSHQPHLNGKYTLFGKVLSGMEVVDTILPGDKINEIKPVN